MWKQLISNTWSKHTTHAINRWCGPNASHTPWPRAEDGIESWIAWMGRLTPSYLVSSSGRKNLHGRSRCPSRSVPAKMLRGKLAHQIASLLDCRISLDQDHAHPTSPSPGQINLARLGTTTCIVYDRLERQKNVDRTGTLFG